jgi:hypothetical protein
LLFLPPLLRAPPEAFLPLLFEDFAAFLDLDDFVLRALFFDFELLVDPLFLLEARAFEVLALFFVVPLFFDDFFPRLFEPGAFVTAFALAATFLKAFFTGAADELRPAAALPAIAPITPPTTAPTGPATLPIKAPVAAPAASLEMGGISMFCDDSEFSDGF